MQFYYNELDVVAPATLFLFEFIAKLAIMLFHVYTGSILNKNIYT